MQMLTYIERTLYTGNIKPANMLVSNSHYSNLQWVDLKVAYEKTPIVWSSEILEKLIHNQQRQKFFCKTVEQMFWTEEQGVHGTRDFKRGRNAWSSLHWRFESYRCIGIIDYIFCYFKSRQTCSFPLKYQGDCSNGACWPCF